MDSADGVTPPSVSMEGLVSELASTIVGAFSTDIETSNVVSSIVLTGESEVSLSMANGYATEIYTFR
jgi:hypothetical protein